MSGSNRSVAASLARAKEGGLFSALDVQFATRLGAICQEDDSDVLWGAAIVCRQESHGHVCADLPDLEARGLVAEFEGESRSFALLPEGVDLDGWLEKLRASPLVDSASGEAVAGAPRPLILDTRGRLYLRRSHVDETRLAKELRARGDAPDLPVDWVRAEADIDRLLPANANAREGSGEAAPDWPRIALRTALARPLSIITGGPGTGKTTLVARLIALLTQQRLDQGESPPTVRLLAPTGRAAAAMSASFDRQRGSLDVEARVLESLPSSAETIHRALLRHSNRDALGRVHERPLSADIVVVDEASMVDFAQMRELFSICREVERLVLLGDPDQLASIDAGAALAEICSVASDAGRAGAGPPDATAEATAAETGTGIDFEARAESGGRAAPRLVDSVVTLRESHRFSAGSAIGLLADAIRTGDADRVLEILADPAHPEAERIDADSVAEVRARLVASVEAMQAGIEAEATADGKLGHLTSRRVLCAYRGGPLGVEALCEVLDEAAAAQRRTSRRVGWWPGQLLLVTRNAPEQDLWNGDVGLVEETESGLRALFSDSSGGVRTLSAGRLPSTESAIAMSVHKSQGSEYDVVDLVLGRAGSRLMTRELLYTGVTRARERICLHGSEEAIRDALSRRVERDSGLAEMLSDGESRG